jgi:hypothetical protein
MAQDLDVTSHLLPEIMREIFSFVGTTASEVKG